MATGYPHLTCTGGQGAMPPPAQLSAPTRPHATNPAGASLRREFTTTVERHAKNAVDMAGVREDGSQQRRPSPRGDEHQPPLSGGAGLPGSAMTG